jgi:hypothetical protein
MVFHVYSKVALPFVDVDVLGRSACTTYANCSSNRIILAVIIEKRGGVSTRTTIDQDMHGSKEDDGRRDRLSARLLARNVALDRLGISALG